MVDTPSLLERCLQVALSKDGAGKYRYPWPDIRNALGVLTLRAAEHVEPQKLQPVMAQILGELAGELGPIDPKTRPLNVALREFLARNPPHPGLLGELNKILSGSSLEWS
jgi:hypothetical protein